MTGPDIPSPGMQPKLFARHVLSTQWTHRRSHQQAGVTTAPATGTDRRDLFSLQVQQETTGRC